MRLNRVVECLKNDQTAFGALVAPPLTVEEAHLLVRDGFDMVILEMEHTGFDFPGLRTSLQSMLDRGSIAQRGLSPDVLPIVRIPTAGREQADWIIKQTLDSGAYGLVLPHLETVDEAVSFIAASSYQAKGASGSHDSEGRRGFNPTFAMHYWGISMQEYVNLARPWPADQQGELLLVAMIESQRGLENLPQILASTAGIGLIWPGAGDLSASLGLIGEPTHPHVGETLLEILAICKKAGVACAASAADADAARRRIEEGFQVIITSSPRGFRPSEIRNDLSS